MLTRRTLLRDSLRISAGLALVSSRFAFSETESPLMLKRSGTGPVHISANFMGLGYEMSSVARLGLLSAANRRYIRLIRELGSEGVIRVGGIVADYTRYEPNGAIVAEPKNTVITSASLRQFDGFLRKTGWKAIWSLNFAQGSVKDAVEEARAVSAALGPRLLALEIGNEVENYARGKTPFRNAPYLYETYRSEFATWRAAILQAVPGVSFAAPDTASSVEWVERMAKDARGDVQLLTTHYYRGGSGQKGGTAERLLHPDPHLGDTLVRLRTAAEESGIPWRMCETNSFSGGGIPGVSDTFAGALWVLDFMLLLAEFGCSGVNIETGVNQLGFVSCYSPIQDDGRGMNTAGVPYYGMLAFAVAMKGCDEILPLDVETRGTNMTAYALGKGGVPSSVVIVNKDESLKVDLSFRELGLGKAYALRMLSPSSDSKTGVTFGDAEVNPSGEWKAKTVEPISDGRVVVPPMSAVVLRSSASGARV